MANIKQLLEKAEELYWDYSPCEYTNKDYGYEFENYTTYGQDFIFSISSADKSGKESADAMIENLRRYIDAFHPCEEALIWVGADGKGKNGAPEDFTDIVSDMEECKQMMWNLLDAWEKLNTERYDTETERTA